MILNTKFFKPIIHRHYIQRAEIDQKLEQGVNGPLLLVSAPSGYGKSTAVSAFLSQSKIPSVWISLGPEENNLPLFVEYLITAVKQVIPDFGADTLGLIHTPEPVAEKILIAHVVNEFYMLDQDMIIAFDDFHHINELGIIKLITDLLAYPSIHMHLVIITRRDPGLPMTTYRTKGAVIEVRARDLKFNRKYTGILLEERLQEKVPEELIVSIHKKLDGWIAGLNLLLMGGDSITQIQQNLNEGSKDSLAIKNIVQNSLKGVPSDIRQTILMLSLVDEFSAELCNAIGGESKTDTIGTKVLDYLLDSSLFIVNLDSEGKWYRYHHLFRDIIFSILQDHFADSELREVYMKAAQWCEAQKDPQRAIDYYIKAGEVQCAIQLFEPIRKECLSTGAWRKIERLYFLFPESIVDSSVTLFLAKNWILAIQANFKAHFQSVMATDFVPKKMVENGDYESNILGECYVMQASPLLNKGGDDEKLMHYIDRSLELQDGSNNYAYGLAVGMKGFTLRRLGKQQQALEVFQKYLKPGYGSRFDTWLLMTMSLFHWMELNIDKLEVIGKQLLKIGKTKNFTEAETSGLYFCGLCHYTKNEFSRAKEFFEAGYAKRFMSFSNPRLGNYLALTKTYAALGDITNAKLVLEELRENAMNDGNSYMVNVAMAAMAEIHMQESNRKEISKWVNHAADHPLIQPHGFFHPRLTHIKALLYLGTPTLLEKAQSLMDQWLQFLDQTKPKNFYIETYLTQAWMRLLQDDEASALELVDKAIKLAQESGYIASFLGISSLVLSFIEANSEKFNKYAIYQSIQFLPKVPQYNTSNPLSSRELDIVELLPQRITNKEIGAQLFISEDTVKKHLTSIFKKLEVKNRRTAVQKAQEKGIIS